MWQRAGHALRTTRRPPRRARGRAARAPVPRPPLGRLGGAAHERHERRADLHRPLPPRDHPPPACAGAARPGPRVRLGRARGRRPRRRRQAPGGLDAAAARRGHEAPPGPGRGEGRRAPAAPADPGGRAAPRGPPALPPARQPRRAPPLRPEQRVLRALPRRLHDVLVRDLRDAGAVARGRPGQQARDGLPQARARPGHARARRGLRLGRVRAARGQEPRRARHGHHALARAGGGSAEARRGRGPRGEDRDPGAGLPRAPRRDLPGHLLHRDGRARGGGRTSTPTPRRSPTRSSPGAGS